MSKPSQEDIESLFKDLTIYKDRIKREMGNISKNLRISSSQLNSTLKNHDELNQLDKILAKLKDMKTESSDFN